MSNRAPRIDLDELRAALLDRLESLVECLLGARNRAHSRRAEWRWGGKGSLAVQMHGRKRGTWYSHEAGEGGGPLQLVQHVRRCSLAEAIVWAADFTGLSAATDTEREQHQAHDKRRQEERARRHAAEETKEAADRAHRIGVARDLAAGSEPPASTPADRYLMEHRTIWPPTGWPAAVRFHRATNALLVIATAADGAVQAVQRVYLDHEGRKAEATPSRPAKQTNGVLEGASVQLPGPTDGPLLLAEGFETGASVWAATGYQTWIGLGALGNLCPPSGRLLVACRDDDPRFSPADRAYRRALKDWQGKGLAVVTATPWPTRRYDKTDFNDTLREDGADAVRARIAAALKPAGQDKKRLSIKQARDVLAREVERWGVAALAFDELEANAAGSPAPVMAVRTDVGSGKSLCGRRRAARMLAEMRSRGDQRTMFTAIPTHSLGEEQAIEFESLPEARAAGLRALVFRGREAKDPEAPGQQMCRNLDAVKDAIEAGVSVQKAACRRRGDDGEWIECPFYRVCGYQRQLQQSADLWFVAHEMLFTTKPSAMGKFAAGIVDENPAFDGLEGVDRLHPTRLPLDALDQETLGESGASEHVEELKPLHDKALTALHAHKDGPLNRVLMACHLTKQEAAQARALEFQRIIDPALHPMMTKAQRREAMTRAAGNRTVMRLARFWQAMEALLSPDGPEASGWALLETVSTDEGPVRMLRLRRRKPVAKGWRVPTLLMDATMRPELLTHYWPQMKVIADIAIETPYQRIRQVIDRSYSLGALEQTDEYGDEDARRRYRNLRRVHAIICREARRFHNHPHKVLVVCQERIKLALADFGPLPPNVDLAHHNAIAGKDGWRDTPLVIVIGRTAPGPLDVETLASTLTGAACPSLGIGKWFDRVDAVRETVAGEWPNQVFGAVPAEADQHLDPTAEAIRWLINEGELVQIIGRPRGVNRTADDPVEVLVMADPVLPVPVSELLSASDLEPDLRDLMLAAGGVSFENPRHAAAAYGRLWPSENAAKIAFKRERLGSNPNKNLPIGKRPQPLPEGLERVAYQIAGPGRSPAAALCDMAVVPDPAGWLAERLGPLAWCRIEERPPPPDPTPDQPASADASADPEAGTEPPLASEGAAVLDPDLDPDLADWESEFATDEQLGLGADPDPDPGGPWFWAFDRAPLRFGEALGGAFGEVAPGLHMYPAMTTPAHSAPELPA